MKDPLQEKNTPYEILGVQVNADKKAIETAFKKSVASGRNVREATRAWNTLNSPIERAFCDIFLYNETFLNHLRPCIGKDNSQLLNRRTEVAQAWTIIQKKLFPHFASTHSLALLWYWWTLYCEEEEWAQLTKVDFKRKKNLSVSNTFWPNTISNWVFLINSDDFWTEWTELKKTIETHIDDNCIKDLRQKLERYFINIFHNLSERYRNNGDSSSAKRYQEYELLFSSEMRTAKLMFEEGVRLPKGEKMLTICCGRLMLEQVGMLDVVQKQIGEIIQKVPQKDKLRKLAESLSPLANIVVLIENKKFDEAIQTIKALPSEKQIEKEILHLLAKTYLEKGKQHFSLNQFRDAFDCWENGLGTGELGEEITQAMVFHCKTKAASLQNSDPDTAIEILKGALKLVKDKDLQLTLAEIFTQHAIGIINKAQQKIKSEKKGVTPEIISDFEKSVSYLKQSIELGSKRAEENLEMAENIIEQAKLGFLPLDKNEIKVLNDAEKAIGAGNIDASINIIEVAIKNGKVKKDSPACRILAQYMNASAVEKLNKATPTMNKAMKFHESIVPGLISSFLNKKSKLDSVGTWSEWYYLILVGVIYGLVELYKFNTTLFIWVISVLSLIIIIGLIKKLSKLASKFSYNAYGQMTSSCDIKGCGDSASYVYDIPTHGKKSLCSSHASDLREITEKVFIDQDTGFLIQIAESLLERAVEYDRNNKQVKQNLSEARRIANQFKVNEEYAKLLHKCI